MKYHRKGIRRRLLLFIVSVLPLLADDDLLLTLEGNHDDNDHDGTTTNIDDNINSIVSLRNHHMSLPQHEINQIHQKQQQQQQCYHSTSSSSSSMSSQPEMMVRYRRMDVADTQLWTIVTLPSTYNNTTFIPFYPFDDDYKNNHRPTYSVQRNYIDNITDHDTDNADDDDNNASLSEIVTSTSQTNISDPIVQSLNSSIEDTMATTDHTVRMKVKEVDVDYASKSAGAIILDASTNFQGASNLLEKDIDKYAIIPCEEQNKYVVIGLSEDILIKKLAISNYERYSSHMKEIRLYGSTSTTAIRGSDMWIDLGIYTSNSMNQYGIQMFDIYQPTWVRYIKVEFLSYYGDEFYCTISKISVHGSTVLQGFHEQWDEDEREQASHDTNKDLEINTNMESATHTATSESDVDSNVASNDNISNDETIAFVTMKPETVEPSNQMDIRCYENGSCQKWKHDFSWRNLTTFNYSVVENNSVTLNTLLSRRHDRLYKKCQIISLQQYMTRKVKLQNSSKQVVLLEQSKRKTLMIPRLTMERNSQFHMEHWKYLLRDAVGSKATEKIIKYTSLQTQKRNNKMIEQELINVNIPISKSSIDVDTRTNEATESNTIDPNEKVIQETGLMLAKILKKFPSADCLKNLNFADFKATSKTTATKPRNGSSSTNGGSNTAMNMEPVFKKLSDEIKSLQSNVAIHDQFAKESVSCYQQVMLEMLLEMESDRRSYDTRISKLESDAQLGIFIVTIQNLISWIDVLLFNFLDSVYLLLTRLYETCDKWLGTLNVLYFTLIVFISYSISLYYKWKYPKNVISPPIVDNMVINGNGAKVFQHFDRPVVSEDEDDQSHTDIPNSHFYISGNDSQILVSSK